MTVTTSLMVTAAVTTSPAFRVLFCAPVAPVMATLLTVGATVSVGELETVSVLVLAALRLPAASTV